MLILLQLCYAFLDKFYFIKVLLVAAAYVKGLAIHKVQ